MDSIKYMNWDENEKKLIKECYAADRNLMYSIEAGLIRSSNLFNKIIIGCVRDIIIIFCIYLIPFIMVYDSNIFNTIQIVSIFILLNIYILKDLHESCKILKQSKKSSIILMIDIIYKNNKEYSDISKKYKLTDDDLKY